MIKRALLCVAALMLLSAATIGQSKSMQGVWKVVEMTTTGENAATKAISQPSTYIFTKNHYSIIYVASDAARPVHDDISKLTAEELRNIYVRDFVANAGTYEIKAGKLTIRPMVAKAPTTMRAGSSQTYAITINGTSMTLVNEASDLGPVKNPTTRKLVRVE